ncbi:MAG TPA: type II toxin-antitoxin system HipA family toxin [bacterium]|nr:type II toxin-antitoxin system HipA family toxin [bacterium]
MRKLLVNYALDPRTLIPVGHLAESEGRVLFEYDPSFIERGIELSPFFLPLKPGLIAHTDRTFGPLWGVFDDSLPDGWGLLLMDRYFRKRGLSLRTISPLDRLAFLGMRTMGALTYHPPAERDEGSDRTLDLQELAEQSLKILNGEEAVVLSQLLAAGGSPGGARPKVLVGYDPRKKVLLSGEALLPAGYEHWLVKFSAKDDLPDSAAIEFAYALMARAAGIVLPETRFFGDGKARYFGTKRFDRNPDGKRFHLHTFGNMVHADFRIPSVDYTELLRVTALLTRDQSAVREMFRRMVFNVLAHNRDDHAKNFSFILDIEQPGWRVSPAYDLTFAEGPGGEHSMSVDGNGKDPSVADILRVAEKSGIGKAVARRIVDEVAAAVRHWARFADEAGVSKGSTKNIAKYLQ